MVGRFASGKLDVMAVFESVVSQGTVNSGMIVNIGGEGFLDRRALFQLSLPIIWCGLIPNQSERYFADVQDS